MKNVLVTGGSGFIGSNFINRVLELNLIDKVVNLDKLTYAGNIANTEVFESDKRYKFKLGDICDQNLVENIYSR